MSSGPEFVSLSLLPDVLTPPTDVLYGSESAQKFDIFIEGEWETGDRNTPYVERHVTESSPLWPLMEMLRARRQELNQAYTPDHLRDIAAINFQMTLARNIHSQYQSYLRRGIAPQTAIEQLEEVIETRDQAMHAHLNRRIDTLFRLRAEAEGYAEEHGARASEKDKSRWRRHDEAHAEEIEKLHQHLQHLQFEWLSARAITHILKKTMGAEPPVG